MCRKAPVDVQEGLSGCVGRPLFMSMMVKAFAMMLIRTSANVDKDLVHIDERSLSMLMKAFSNVDRGVLQLNQ